MIAPRGAQGTLLRGKVQSTNPYSSTSSTPVLRGKTWTGKSASSTVGTALMGSPRVFSGSLTSSCWPGRRRVEAHAYLKLRSNSGAEPYMRRREVRAPLTHFRLQPPGGDPFTSDVAEIFTVADDKIVR